MTERQIRAGCYLRISSDPRDKRNGVDRQRADTTALCEVKGWVPAGYYEDNDRSASDGGPRPAWDRLLSDIAAGKIDAIAAWDQDRGWRMMSELETLRKFFTSLGRQIPLATTGQGDVDLYSPTGVLTAQVKTAVSEHEVAMLKVRLKRAAKQKAERGIPQWRKAFGYIDMGGAERALDPTTAPLVAEAYRAIIAGASLNDVATLFNDAGGLTINGKQWGLSAVSQFLRKPRNAGLRSHHDQIVGKGTWPPLVDMQTWEAAQAVLDAPGRTPGRKSVRQHLLTGALWCGVCGNHLSGNWVMKRDGGHAIDYRCKACNGCGIRAANVEPIVYKLVGGRLARPDAVDLLKADVADAEEAERLTAEANGLYAQIRAAEAEYDDGVIDGRRLAARRERVAEKLAVIEAAQQDQERLRVFDGIPLGTPEAVDAVQKLSPDRFRAVVDVLVKITIKPTGKAGNRFNPRRVVPDWKR